MREVLLSGTLFMLNLALNLTVGKYGWNVPDWLIIACWLLPLVPLVYLAITHEKALRHREWYMGYLNSKPISTTLGSLAVVLIITVSLAIACMRIWSSLAKPTATANQSFSTAPVTTAPPTANDGSAEPKPEPTKPRSPLKPRSHSQTPAQATQPATALPQQPPMQLDCGGGNCAQSTGQQGGITAGQVNVGSIDRHVTPGQVVALGQMADLVPESNKNNVLITAYSSGEAEQYADELAAVLQSAGIEKGHGRPPTGSTWVPSIPRGVVVCISQDTELKDLGVAIANSLVRMGIPSVGLWDKAPVSAKYIVLMVGEKTDSKPVAGYPQEIDLRP